MYNLACIKSIDPSLPSREAWIEIMGGSCIATGALSRFPRGKRGLKLSVCRFYRVPGPSLPSREAWIEIEMVLTLSLSRARRFPRGKRGLKWFNAEGCRHLQGVASLAGSVD